MPRFSIRPVLAAVCVLAASLAPAQEAEKSSGLDGQNFLLTAAAIDVWVSEGSIESLNANDNVRMEMRQDPGSTELAPPSGDSAGPSAGEGGGFLGRDFVLFSQKLDLSMKDGEVGQLVAVRAVALSMSDLDVTGDRLVYDGASQILTTWGAPGVPCVVNRAGVTTTCEQFIYNVKTGKASIGSGAGGAQALPPLPGEARPPLMAGGRPTPGANPAATASGASRPRVEKDDFILQGDDIQIDENPDFGVTTVTVTGSHEHRATLSSKNPPKKRPQGDK